MLMDVGQIALAVRLSGPGRHLGKPIYILECLRSVVSVRKAGGREVCRES